MGIHILAPSVQNPAVAKGGTSLYRSVAATAGQLAPTVCYEIVPPPAAGPRWRGDRVEVVRRGSAGEVRAELRGRLRPGDAMLKWAGALGGSANDWLADLWVAELASSVDGVRCCYLDADAPFRLPLLNDRHHLGLALDGYDAVMLFAGGRRAVAGYEALAGQPGPAVHHLSPVMFVVALLGHVKPNVDIGAGDARSAELLVPVAAASQRESRVAAHLSAWLAADPGLALAFVGDWPSGARYPNMRNYGLMDPDELFQHYRESRFTLNTLRTEFAGWTDTAAARIFEAALAGSVVITERFPGLEHYLEPGVECLVVDRLDDVLSLLNTPEHERRQIAGRARRRVEEAVGAAQKEFAEILGAPRRASVARVAPRRAADPAAVALLPGVSPAFAQRLREQLPCARFVDAGSPAEAAAYGVDALATTTVGKNRVDDELRAHGWAIDAVFVEVVDRPSAQATRWIPGRDWTLGDDDRWPWLD